MRVTLFTTCLVDTLFPSVGRATVELLERLGHTVEFPPGQTCCGQMHLNSGAAGAATTLATRLIDTLAGAEAVVIPSASCAATIIDDYAYLARLAGNERLAQGADALRQHTYELSQFLSERLGIEDVGARFPAQVTYHPSCHSLRKLRVGDAPLRLLRAVQDLELVNLPRAEACCGFGGTFAVKNSAVSSGIGVNKLQALRESGASVCTSLDMSCLMQIQGISDRHRAPIRTLHLAEILASHDGDTT